jgi:hypothetical protein
MEEKNQKMKATEGRLVRLPATKKLMNEEEIPSARPTAAAAPPPASRRRYPALMTCDLAALTAICEEALIDLSTFNARDLSEEKRREEMVLALLATDPSERDRFYYKKLSQLTLTDSNVEQEVDQMFELLLNKFEETKGLREGLKESFSTEEKIQHLRNSIW